MTTWRLMKLCCPALFIAERRTRWPLRLDPGRCCGGTGRSRGEATSIRSHPLQRPRTPQAIPNGKPFMTDAPGEIVNAGDANVWSEYEIETHTSLVERRLRTLKHGDAFAVLDSYGDMGTAQGTAEGLFYRDTRYLSHYELRIEGRRPLLLSSTMHEDKAALSVDLTNPDVALAEHDQ